MDGESAEVWRAVLDDLIQRGLRRPKFLIIDGADAPVLVMVSSRTDNRSVRFCTIFP